MIELVKARSGRQVLKVDGRLMASAIDPVKEAVDWIERRRSFLDKVESVFVLGAGAGYHIAELLNQTNARIIVLEADTALIRQVKNIHAFDSDRVRIIPLTTIRDLRANDNIRLAIVSSFVVLQHSPSISLHPEIYRDCRALLIGRDWGSLNWQWQLRGFAPLDSRPRIDVTPEPLSILDLEQTELIQNSEERERMLVKALRELVK